MKQFRNILSILALFLLLNSVFIPNNAFPLILDSTEKAKSEEEQEQEKKKEQEEKEKKTQEEKKTPEEEQEEEQEEVQKAQQIPTSVEQLIVNATSEEQLDKNNRIANGYVDIHYKGQRLQADKVTYNTETFFFQAEGNVVFQQKDMTIAGDRMEANLQDKTGTFFNAIIYTEPEFIITGDRIVRLSEDEYKIYKGRFTACSQPNPRWCLTTGQAKVKVDHYISLRNPALRVKGVPVFYVPYLYWPLKKDRATGFLMPTIGSSNLKGMIISNAFFWAMRRNMDSTFFLDYYSKLGWGRGAEYRYIMGKHSKGNFYGYYLSDKTRDMKRYKIKYNHAQYLPGGFRAVVDVNYLSDFQYLQDLEQKIQLNTSRSIGSRAYLSWSKSYYSLNVVTSRDTTYFSEDSSVTLQSLPRIDFASRDQKLGGSPIYFSFSSSFNSPARIIEQGDFRNEMSLNRGDFDTRVSVPIKSISWLTINPGFEFRDTYYSKQKHPKLNLLIDEPINRTFYVMSLGVTGPVFNKIFGGQKENSTRYKHIIEPRASIVYISDPKNQEYVWRYDSVDTVSEVKELRYSLASRLLSKRVTTGAKQSQVREFLTVEFSQNFSLDPNLRTSYGRQFNLYTGEYMDKPIVSRFSPAVIRTRFNPTSNYYLDSTLEYDIEERNLNSFSIGTEMNIPNRTNINFSWRKTFAYGFGRIPRNIIASNGAFYAGNKRLSAFYDLNYDFENQAMLYSSIGMQYQAQCITFLVNYRRYNIYRRQENEFRFLITLANLGSIGS
jgi:LPS-assembly protein